MIRDCQNWRLRPAPDLRFRRPAAIRYNLGNGGPAVASAQVMYLFILDSLGNTELLVILGAALIFFGPRRLPQLSRQLGKGLSEFRRASEDFKRTWEREVNLETFDKGFESDAASTILDKATQKIRAAREAAALDAGVASETEVTAPVINPIEPELVQPRDQGAGAEPAQPDQPGGKQDWL